jgi:RNA polymerase sigma factor (TIGR02999 family)
MSDLASLLQTAAEQDPASAGKLLPEVYEELRRIAARRLSSQPGGQTLQATALVHEAFLRLVGDTDRTWRDRRHFFAAATEAMRHILVDRARRKAAVRHGGGLVRVELDNIHVAAEASDESVLRLNDSLERLAGHNPEAAEIIRLRFFGGFTFAQAAEMMGISERTAKRLWAYARTWLFEEISRSTSPFP